MQNPDFWKDHVQAGKISEQLAMLKDKVAVFGKLEAKVEGMLSLPAEEISEEEIKTLEKEIASQEVYLFLNEKYDKNDAIVGIYSGAGGHDAQDWASMLLRMYIRWAEKEKFEVVVIHEHQGENGGIKNVSLKISGMHAYGYLRGESGVHRLVRISPFSAQQLRHTSFALVEVLPVIESAQLFVIKDEDLKVDTFRSSGPGGQNVNKRETAIRITHIPTGIQVVSQTTRTQSQNRELAMQLLQAKLVQMMKEQNVENLEKLKVGMREPEWGSQIRSYVLHPYKMVKDHRTNMETSRVEAVLEGDLNDFIWKELEWLKESAL